MVNVGAGERVLIDETPALSKSANPSATADPHLAILIALTAGLSMLLPRD